MQYIFYALRLFLLIIVITIFPSVHLASFLQCILDLTLTSSLVAQTVQRLPTVRETQDQSLGWKDLLEKETATHSSILAWKIPWMEEPGGLQSIESNRVGHNWVTSLSLGHTLQLYFAFSLFGCAGLSWDMRGYSVAACGIQLPDQGLNPGLLHWEHGGSATGPPGTSLCLVFQIELTAYRNCRILRDSLDNRRITNQEGTFCQKSGHQLKFNFNSMKAKIA